MPRRGPPASGYERIAQAAELSDSDSDNGNDESTALVAPPQPRGPGGHYVPIAPPSSALVLPAALSSSTSSPGQQPHHHRSSSAVDIKVINARLEKWAEQIANKFKFRRDRGQHEQPPLEILHSVFVPPDAYRDAPAVVPQQQPPAPAAERAQLSRAQFDDIVQSFRSAIAKGVDPKLIKQGSSGSYFMRDSDGRIVAVFKPKDEEPYGKLNPKMMKWLHRTLFPCFFGRSCLIPNLSYISEAAACLLDRQLRTYLVPYTDIVHLSSKAFHYDFWDRRAFYRRHKPLPPKVGSFQVFLQGFEDANVFLRKHPWPDPYNTGFRTDALPKRRAPWNYACGPSGADEDAGADDDGGASPPWAPEAGSASRRFVWTEQLQQSFREELEKLVILDYIMRNTDRGLDNWMIRIDHDTGDVSVTSRPVNLDLAAPVPGPAPLARPASTDPAARTASPLPYRVQEPMVASRSSTPLQASARVRLGAIDNSLAFPWKHPDQWRSFPFGWLFLPVSLIGQPFSQKTRDHFIPLLTSTKWWSETQTLLRKLFEQDADFKERMFQKQLAVLKGQAFNVVETLKAGDQGPLELTRRVRMHVWDDEMEVPIAVPLRMPSSEERRRHELDLERGLDEDEMDIGNLVSSAPSSREHDLLGLSPPSSQLPSALRLGTSHAQASTYDVERADGQVDSEASSLHSHGTGIRSGAQSTRSEPHGYHRPSRRSRVSYDSGMVTRGARVGKAPWGASVSGRPTRRGSHTLGFPPHFYSDDDADGDLGYSAVTGSEGARRRVIAERLEAVKSRNPVFTWC